MKANATTMQTTLNIPAVTKVAMRQALRNRRAIAIFTDGTTVSFRRIVTITTDDIKRYSNAGYVYVRTIDNYVDLLAWFRRNDNAATRNRDRSTDNTKSEV